MSRRGFGLAALATLTVAIAACGPAVPNYQNVWSTTATSTTPSDAPPQPFSEYLENLGVVGQPMPPDKLQGLSVTLPTPAGWEQYSNANLAPGTRTIAKGDTYPIAMLIVFQLTGDFDPAEVIKHADADALRSENFRKLNGSQENYDGFPSSMIEGSYDLNGRRMQSYNRVVIATSKPPRPGLAGQRYLIQLTVTSFADQAQANGPDVEAILKGFRVAAT